MFRVVSDVCSKSRQDRSTPIDGLQACSASTLGPASSPWIRHPRGVRTTAKVKVARYGRNHTRLDIHEPSFVYAP
jgi:hypothetical protein